MEKSRGDDAEDEFDEERECDDCLDRDSGTMARLSMPSVTINSIKEGRLVIESEKGSREIGGREATLNELK